MSDGFPGQRQDKSVEDCNYRPFIELECRLCQAFFGPTSSNGPLIAHPMVLADVGARGEVDPFWVIFGQDRVELSFEAEQEEGARLVRENTSNGRTNVFPVGLSDSPGTRILHVTKNPFASSLYPPQMDYYRRLPDASSMEVMVKQSVKVSTLDQCLGELENSTLDVLKMDVQGAELDILRGAEKALSDGLLAVVAEVEFVELYRGQPLFADIDLFLRKKGFAPFDLDIRRWRRRPLGASFSNLRVGQIVYADAVYLKDPIAYPELFAPRDIWRNKLLKLMALAERFSVPDYGIELAEFAVHEGVATSDEAALWSHLLRSNSIVRTNNRHLVPPNLSIAGALKP